MATTSSSVPSSARSTTIRTTLINIPARLAFSAGTYTFHLPANSRREAVHDDVRQHPGPTPSGLPDPLIVRHPRSDQRHPDTPMTDRAIPATRRSAASPSRSTGSSCPGRTAARAVRRLLSSRAPNGSCIRAPIRVICGGNHNAPARGVAGYKVRTSSCAITFRGPLIGLSWATNRGLIRAQRQVSDPGVNPRWLLPATLGER